MDDYEDVPGAAAAAREILARDYAWRRIAVQLDDTEVSLPRTARNPETLRAAYREQAIEFVEHAAELAGLTPADLDAAELEVRRLYINAPGRRYLLANARHHLALLQAPAPDGPGPDAEDHRTSGDDGLPL